MIYHKAKAGRCKKYTGGDPQVHCAVLDENAFYPALTGEAPNLLCTKSYLARSKLRVFGMTLALKALFKKVDGSKALNGGRNGNGMAIPHWCPSHTHLAF